MSNYPNTLFRKYKAKGILIDTNLMLLVAIGNYDLQRILTFKNTFRYTLDDYALMVRMIRYFDRRLTTPHILTEVDNLGRQLRSNEFESFSESVRQLIQTLFEVYVRADSAAQHPYYARLGIADSVTAISATEALVVTDDFELSSRLTSDGYDAININHIRNMYD